MHRGAWQAIVRRVAAKSQTQLKQLSMHAHKFIWHVMLKV